MRIRAIRPRTNKKEITDAKRVENGAVLVRRLEPSEKRDFFARGGVFSLDSPFNGRPLMGDPFAQLHIKRGFQIVDITGTYAQHTVLARYWTSSFYVNLGTWTQEARTTGIKHFEKLADSLLRHKEGLLAYFAQMISTGRLEGLNNKIKLLKRQVYGFRDIE